jgi:hypothetical protein
VPVCPYASVPEPPEGFRFKFSVKITYNRKLPTVVTFYSVIGSNNITGPRISEVMSVLVGHAVA